MFSGLGLDAEHLSLSADRGASDDAVVRRAMAWLASKYRSEIAEFVGWIAQTLRELAAQFVRKVTELIKALEPLFNVAGIGLLYVVSSIGDLFAIAASEMEREAGDLTRTARASG